MDQVHGAKGPAAIRKTLGLLGGELKLRLPKGRDKLIEDELAISLKKINDYDPETFRKLLLDLGKSSK